MTLTKQIVFGSVNVTPVGTVEVRRDTCILEDGVVIGIVQSHSHVIAPGADLTSEDPRVALIALATSVPLAALPQATASLTSLIPKSPAQQPVAP